ncbi:MAG TPA: DUF1080 domain-containing protein [Methylomirabilota bacterium]|nr:DUF1080 domain-containing protein [Methylomirabilota bacterium]
MHTKHILCLVLLLLGLSTSKSADDSEAGFVPLFDGKSLAGWKLMHGKGPGYIVQDGMLICPENGGGNLFTERQYTDFAFRFEFQLKTNSNNGIGIRAPLEGAIHYVGMEIQVLDDAGPQWAGKLKPAQYHGSLYDVIPAKQGALRKTSEWNEQEIRCIGRKITVTLNDQLILDADINTVTDPNTLAAHPGLLRERGHIGFLGHDAFVAYRNIRLKDLSRTQPVNTPPAGFVSLFNGKDLSGWQGLIEIHKRAKMSVEDRARAQAKADKNIPQNWQVEDGTIAHIGKGFENLCTEKDYGNFELWVDWLTERKADSGLYLRGYPQVQIWAEPVGSGGLFNNKKHRSEPTKRADKPLGNWNNFKILMQGDRVTVYLNEELVAHNIPLENYWDRDKPIFPVGPIELQAHEDPVRFRNIYIRELPNR